MGFNLFNQEDPREWTENRIRDQFETFKNEQVVGTHCESCQYDPNPVIKRGTIKTDFMIVGDYTAPADQQTDKPFSGPAGDLLGKMIDGIDLDWEEHCYVTNALLCDGTEEPPRKSSVESCHTNLSRQLDIVTPEVVLAMGKYAAQSLLELNASDSLSDHLGYQGSPANYPWIDLVVTFNPAYLLRLDDGTERKQNVKKMVWSHLKKAKSLLDQAAQTEDVSETSDDT